MESKKTVVLGASTNPSRYAYLASQRLLENGHEIVLVGIKKGEVKGHQIQTNVPDVEQVDTVTLYLGPKNQLEYYDYVVSLKPKRVIFNPGTENNEFYALLERNGIQVIEGCTLVMLAAKTY